MLQLGNWDVEVDNPVPTASLINGSAFLGSNAPPIATVATKRPMLAPPTARQMQPLTRRPGAAVAPARANANGEAASAVPAGAHLLQSGTDGGKAVYIDAFLVKHLRPHQIEGVQFLYDVRSPRHLSFVGDSGQVERQSAAVFYLAQGALQAHRAHVQIAPAHSC